jgi:hypothetical protein
MVSSDLHPSGHRRTTAAGAWSTSPGRCDFLLDKGRPVPPGRTVTRTAFFIAARASDATRGRQTPKWLNTILDGQLTVPTAPKKDGGR